MTGLAPGRLLDWCGRHATKLLAASVGVGLLLPWLATLVRPGLIIFIMVPLVVALMRVDLADLGGYVRRLPAIVLISLWLLCASPVVTWLVLSATPLPPTLITAVVLMAAAPPILSSTALAIMLGLDAALSVFSCLLATLIAPLTIPPLALVLLGLELDIGLWDLMLRLMLLVFGAFAGAALLRRLVGSRRLGGLATEIDGLIVLSMVVIAVAIMDGVTETSLRQPGMVVLWIAAAFIANPVLQLLGALVFACLGRRKALTLGLASGNRNMALILATLPAEADSGIFLFFAVAQLPMYTLPALLRPLYLRLLRAP